MEPEAKQPTLEEVKSFLEGFGWNFRETQIDGKVAGVITPYMRSDNKGVLVSLHIEGEFIMVGTVGFIKKFPVEFAKELTKLNDTIKLVKLYVTHEDEDGALNAEVGFELWNESWNQETFNSFMDMLCFGIEKVTQVLEEQKISYETDFINIVDSPKN